MSEATEKKSIDYKARAKRAWETRRANASKRSARTVETATAVTVSRGRGRPRKERTLRFGQFEVSSAVYTYEQVKELGAAAVTTDGSSYRLLRQNGAIVPASTFERA